MPPDSLTGPSILSMARLFEPTSMPLGQKKGRGRRSARPQPRGLQHHSPPPRGRWGEPHDAGVDARATARGRGLRTLRTWPTITSRFHVHSGTAR
jgi:hypothetical protein